MSANTNEGRPTRRAVGDGRRAGGQPVRESGMTRVATGGGVTPRAEPMARAPTSETPAPSGGRGPGLTSEPGVSVSARSQWNLTDPPSRFEREQGSSPMDIDDRPQRERRVFLAHRDEGHRTARVHAIAWLPADDADGMATDRRRGSTATSRCWRAPTPPPSYGPKPARDASKRRALARPAATRSRPSGVERMRFDHPREGCSARPEAEPAHTRSAPRPSQTLHRRASASARKRRKTARSGRPIRHSAFCSGSKISSACDVNERCLHIGEKRSGDAPSAPWTHLFGEPCASFTSSETRRRRTSRPAPAH